MKLLKKTNKGFTLIETLVSISIFTVSISALFTVLSVGISHTNYAKQKIIASYLAQEGIEYMRNMRDTYVLYSATTPNNWNNFKAKLAPCNAPNGCSFNTVFPHDVRVCNNPNDCKLYINNGGYDANFSSVESGFIRKIWMTSDVNEVKIYSNVSWTQGSGAYNISFSENLFNWVE